MMDRLEKFGLAMQKVPPDVYALFMLLVGGVLAIAGRKDEAQLVLGGALAVFKGHSPASKED